MVSFAQTVKEESKMGMIGIAVCSIVLAVLVYKIYTTMYEMIKIVAQGDR